MLAANRVGDWLVWHQSAIAAAWLAVLGAALFARLMAYPLRHDEHFYLVAGYLAEQAHLYEEVHFTHLPNFPLLLSTIFDMFGVERFLFAGRLLIAALWGLGVYALYATARLAGGSRLFAAFIASLLMLDPLLLRTAGMLVTNNFAPVPFALLGLYLFLRGTTGKAASPLACFAGGVCLSFAIGLKANYVVLVPPIAVAALLVPPGLALQERLLRVTLPLVAGAVLAGLPSFYFFAQDPANFLAHVVNFHGDAHVDYWTANGRIEGPVAMSLREKAIVAQQVWLSGTTMLILLLAIILGISRLIEARPRDEAETVKPTWPLFMLGALVVGAALISFVPTPAFPQYYAPPIAFGLIFSAWAYGCITQASRITLRPLMATVMLMASFASLPLLLPELRYLPRPSTWTGNMVHEAAQDMAVQMAQSGNEGRLLTLAPAYGAEARRDGYRQMLLGPFIYRAVEYVDAPDRAFFDDVATPRSIGAILERDPPAAILIGTEDHLDGVLEEWARAHDYRPTSVKLGDRRKDEGILYLRSQPLIAGPSQPGLQGRH
ncbi:phospholipid carrier-dependent glycosyltransferase [Aurantiacibacter poecillastricola]|uniref:phospholipid carrier-dependent glycosyltransferase n=1 Tax=Aurantiacibacter poecillastricola TaxID=3064385 RepID=UPI00273E0F65|nr:phospholipid carrier-dependent glycosyltransferase [Aurantiacibacter sp. 219JJ12-13]MDP5259989.1 phospholipid carrier-dependent glycosyltransferase [Aurantiacibacter sp. 219JJ12-13]